MLSLVERPADAAGLYISHIGGYSRTKFPDSVQRRSGADGRYET